MVVIGQVLRIRFALHSTSLTQEYLFRFFDISLVVSCVLNHKDKSVLEQMFIGAVTTCIEPVICSIENFKLFPNVLEQCVPGIANNIAFTGVLEDLKVRESC